VIATALGAASDDDTLAAVETTENVLLTLDPGLAAAGIFPALDAAACEVSGEEALRDEAELAAARRLRGELHGHAPAEAAALLRERIEATASNAELLSAP
jgi:transcription termination factor Rho